MNTPNWFAIIVKPRKEPCASRELSQRGFDCFVPLRRERRRWSDRTKVVDLPLFPGYVFCRLPLADRIQVLTSPGVSSIAGIGKTPQPIPKIEIESVRRMVDSPLEITPWPYLAPGRQVRLDHGPLAGLQGTVVRADAGSLRIVVSVTLLQRSVSTEIERDWIGGTL